MNRLLLCLVFVGCFSLATLLDSRFQVIRNESSRSSGVLAVLMGDSRQIFANHFFAKADAYFHNGKYPTIFDTVKSTEPSHMTSHEDEDQEHHEAEDKEAAFRYMAPPKDWIERFGQHFTVTSHSHLEGNGREREILPWLKLSAEMDPHHVETYVTAAYWLRKRLNKPEQAEEFLREGLLANPDSYEILLELGRVYSENKKDNETSINLCELALKKWTRIEAPKKEPDEATHLQILGCLVQLEEREGHVERLIFYLQELKKISPSPEAIEKQIQEATPKLPTAVR